MPGMFSPEPADQGQDNPAGRQSVTERRLVRERITSSMSVIFEMVSLEIFAP
jgi:hypothetical protein